MNKKYQTYYYIALILGLLFHATVLFFTFEKTYDAYVHMFFAEHYAQNWFSSWCQKWYTGFTITSYPPLVHQLIALMSKVIGLKMGFYVWSLAAIFLLIRGVYKFSLLWVNHRAAGIAAILTVFSSSIVEALHIFGQLPSLTGVAFLLNACPEVYKWFRFGRWMNFFLALGLLTVTTTAHHVSTIFGMVFFVLPVIGLAVIDNCKEEAGSYETIDFKLFISKALKTIPKAATFGFLVILLTIIVIFPYWYWSKTDPISQVSIPHGSRENFLLEPNLGIIFFLIPWGMMLFFLPFLFRQIFVRRNIFLALSLTLAFVLGTGGTTPIPRMILGDTAFEILTLDRFTFWATMLSLPFWGLFFESLLFGNLRTYMTKKMNAFTYKTILGFFLIGVIMVNVVIVNLSNFKPFQPEKINIKPITNFLSSDQHDQWRYLTLGFGDQMAWLSANTNALTVDGNYHSARRLPELTTRAVERLENAKYQKMEGIGALKDFLCTPEKYHLKYIFSNDKFYEPVLHFNGWTKVQTLENNIVVWEYPDVPPLEKLLGVKDIPKIQRWMWGILPLSFFVLTLILYLLSRTLFFKKYDYQLLERNDTIPLRSDWLFQIAWILFFAGLLIVSSIKSKIESNIHASPENLSLAYFDALDFKRFEDAYACLDPSTRPSYDQFILELSVEDGILASFAKLDEINMQSKNKNNEAIVNVDAHWITSLDHYKTSHRLKMKKTNGKWYLLKDEFEKNIPNSQFFSLPDISFRNQGRRKAKVDNTDREDILDRPEIHVIQASLVKKDQQIYVVGSLQNIDNVPAFVSVEAQLYNDKGEMLDRYKTSDMIVHDLLPKELTDFRINFDNCIDCNPTEVVIFVKSLASDKELYKYIGFQNLNKTEKTLEGNLINYGTHEINVPQIIFSQYNKEKELIWVDAQYLQKGIRPQRKKSFDLNLVNIEEVQQLLKVNKIFINGALNEEMQIDNQASINGNYLEWKDVGDYWINIKANGFVYEINK